MRLVDEVLRYATWVAKKNGHASVGDAHVIVALCVRPEIQKHLSNAGYSTKRLDERVRAAHAAQPDQRGYRGDVEPVIPPDIRAAIEGALEGGLRGWLGRTTAVDVFEAFVRRANLADTRWDDAPIRRFHAAAVKLARLRGHRNVLAEHALVALASRQADDGRFARALVTLGDDPERLRKAWRDRITRRFVGLKLAPLPALIKLASLRSNLAERPELGVDFLVVSLLQQERIARALVVPSRNDILFAYVHGIAPAAPPRIEGPAEIVFYNDDFATQEQVVALILQLGRAADEALALMKAVHEAGGVTVQVSDGIKTAEILVAARATTPTLRAELRRIAPR